MSAMRLIAEFLHEEYGFAPDSTGLASLDRLVAQRSEATRHGTSEEYFLLLKSSPVERQKLLSSVIIPETFFFRHVESFTALADWAKSRRKVPIRILSAACSTGEEAYSIAMCLLDAGFAPGQLIIDAWDVNAPSIAAARRGYYTANAFRAVDLSWRDRYFRPSGQGWIINQELRDLVHFREGNLFALNEEAAWDVIFCRNVLIYFSLERQKNLADRLGRALAPDGMLFLGPAEPPLFFANGWVSSRFTMSFSCVRRTSAAKPAEPAVVSLARPRAPRKPPAMPLRLLPPSAPPPPLQVAAPSPIEQARKLADEGRLAEARPILDEILKREPSNPEVHFLCGIVAEAAKRDEAAEAHYRKALYLQPDHEGALRHMSLLLRSQGRHEAATNLNRRASKHTAT